ncbi:hypothetical protein ACIPIN_14065 [Pseudomonas sp. NPDC087697]|uniref:hypothetical protein n=1 Tax=Pseudomonas sp. NPDC087697 TaxID=3364447 RepID=UPI00381B358F
MDQSVGFRFSLRNLLAGVGQAITGLAETVDGFFGAPGCIDQLVQVVSSFNGLR